MEQIVLQINPRTKEKIVKPLTDCIIYDNYKVSDLINEHKSMQQQIKQLMLINTKLIDVVGNINKSAQVQILDIKEELKQ